MTPQYTPEPPDKQHFTRQFDSFYSRFARLYDLVVKILPTWRRWINQALPHIQGPRVLEISFGTGYLLTQYAGRFQSYGIDYNMAMAQTAHKNLGRAGAGASLQIADVAQLPYADATFDSLVNTMAFTAYPDGAQAMSEMARVLKPGGRLIMVDIDYPADGNRLGVQATKLWMALGDIVRYMAPLFRQNDLHYTDQEIGGFGSVHLYLAHKGDQSPAS